MSEFRPSPEFEEQLRAAADAPVPDSAFVQKLRAELRGKATMNTKRKTILLRPAWAALAVVLALLLAGVVIGPQRVAAAIQKWFGYVPGFGLVRNGDLLVLDGPVSVTQEGITLTVTDAIRSDEKTVVKYSMSGVPFDVTQENFSCMGYDLQPFVRLPDGSVLALQGMSSTFQSPTEKPLYDIELLMGPLPEGVTDLTLVVPCVEHNLGEAVPQKWEVPLHLVPAPPEMTVQPVLEVPTPTAQAAPGLVPAQDGMDVRQVVPTAGGYILSGTIRATPPDGYTLGGDYGGGYFGDMIVTDAAGQQFACGYPPDDYINSNLSALPEGAASWTCLVEGQDIQWPLTVSLASMAADGPALEPSTFQFDAGSSPQLGQVWQLDRDVPLGSKTVRIVKIEFQKNGPQHGYFFTFVADPEMSFRVDLDGYQPMGGGGGADVDASGHGLTYQLLSYPDPFPTGQLTVIVNGNEIIRVPGPWQVTVELPSK
jgi:hypothetical protein